MLTYHRLFFKCEFYVRMSGVQVIEKLASTSQLKKQIMSST